MGKYYNNRPTSKLEQIRDSAVRIHDRIDPGHDIISHDEGEPGYYNDRPKTKLETIRDAAECIAQITENPTGEYQYEELRNVDVASFVSEVTAPIKKLTVGIEPAQSGTGDPSPSNVRPITGWTGAKVTRCGKNLLKLTESEMENSGYNRIFPYTTAPGTFTISHSDLFGDNYGAQIGLLDSSNVSVKIIAASYAFGKGGASDKWNYSFTLTAEEAQKVAKIRFQFSADGATWANVSNAKMQIELGTTATAYEPYQGETYDITFPTEAGTVYGGTLDVTSGVLTVDRAMIASYAGEALPSGWISDRDVYAVGTAPTTGAQVVYELATPVTYQLTPQQITTLLGENNVWADTGKIVHIKYPYAEI